MDASGLKPGCKMLRRKLQKIDSRPKSCQISYADTTKHEAPSTASRRMSIFRSRKSTYGTVTIQEESCPTSPDTIDNQMWNCQLRKSEYLPQDDTSVYSTYPSMSDNEPIPEFAHLRNNDWNPRRVPREHLEPSRPLSFPSAPPYHSRRYAKTPVSRIGQLENSAVRDSATAQTVPNVEAIAESYRALLEPCYSVFRDTQVELPLMEEESEKPGSLPRLDEIPTTPPKSIAEAPEAPVIAATGGSPRSDDGTLVGFEEDGVYPRPARYTLESYTSLKHHEPNVLRRAAPTPPPTPPVKNPSLEISLDLLTRELTSAARGTDLRLNTGTSALQIWVMIEAYEKLRDQLLELQTEGDDTVSAMLDMWLKALHGTYDQMIEGNEARR